MPDSQTILAALKCIVPHMAEVHPWFMPLMAVFVGAVFGSYLTCALYRVPRGLSLWHPPSYCPSCKNTLKIPDLVPVLSWLFFRGKCRQCGVKIPFKYLSIELLSIGAALFSLAVSHGGGSFVFAYGAMVSFGAVVFLLAVHHQCALKSVAFGLLCLGLYVAFQQPLFACSAGFY